MKPYRLLAIAALMGIPLPATAREARGHAPAASGEGDAQLTSTKAANGKELPIRTADGEVTVSDATVAQADIPVTNGTINAIDTVLLPE